MSRLIACAWLVALASGPILSAAPRTIRGEIVDVQCALKDKKNVGTEHVDCALSCAKKGATMGVMAEDGVYTITGNFTRENNRMLLPYVARQVEVTGEVTEKDGKRLIDVSSIGER